MKEFLIKNKKRLCIGGTLILVLAVAFWFGGSSPSSRGWTNSGSSQDSGYASAEGAENLEGQDTESSNAAQGTIQPSEGEQDFQENNDSSQTQENTNGQSGSSSPSSGSAGGSSTSSQVSPSPTETTGGTQSGSSSNSASSSGSNSSSGNTGSTGGGSSSSTVQTTPAPSYSCTISISCKTILNNMDSLKSNKVSIVPSNGWVLKPVKLELKDGDTVFDILQRATQKYKIHMEYSKSPMYNSMYIEGIANLYQFDCGDLSGWMYKVNDALSDYGCSQYKVKDGDVIDWVYTCDLGNDVGGGYAAGN